MTTSVHAWRKAVRRVERRARALQANAPFSGPSATHCAECAHRWRLLREATATANRLAYVAGVMR